MTKLNNPPIVEVWLAIQVEPSPDRLPWNRGTAQEFIEEFSGEFEDAEVLNRPQVEFEKMANGLPKVVEIREQLERVRVFDKGRTSCIQFSNTGIFFNSLRQGSDYQGYPSIYDTAESCFRKYLDFFRPERIIDAAICYADEIKIPVPDQGTIDLGDYFKMSVDPGEEIFGAMSSYEFRATFHCPDDDGPMNLTICSQPRMPDQEHIHMSMEWQKVCLNLDTLDLSVVKQRLDTSKDYLSDCFRESFTTQAWKLFEPVDTMD